LNKKEKYLREGGYNTSSLLRREGVFIRTCI